MVEASISTCWEWWMWIPSVLGLSPGATNLRLVMFTLWLLRMRTWVCALSTKCRSLTQRSLQSMNFIAWRGKQNYHWSTLTKVKWLIEYVCRQCVQTWPFKWLWYSDQPNELKFYLAVWLITHPTIISIFNNMLDITKIPICTIACTHRYYWCWSVVKW